MALNQQAEKWLSQVRYNTEQLQRAIENLEALHEMYTDRGYSGGGFVQGDLDANPEFEDLTLANVGAAMNSIPELLNLRDGVATTPADNGETWNIIRRL